MRKPFVKIPFIIGCVLLLLPHGLMWYWGNISVYPLSYVACTSESSSGVETPWFISLFLVAWNGAILTSDSVAKFINMRWLIFLAILLGDIATLSSFFTIKISLALFTFTSSVIQGLLAGTVFGNVIYLVAKIAEEDVGILLSIVQGAYVVGAMIVSQVATLYVNPNNEIPNMRLGSTVFFSQKDVVDRAPSLFLVLGCFFAALHVIGLVLINFTPGIANLLWNHVEPSERGPLVEKDKIEDGEDLRQKNPDKNNMTGKDYTPKEVLRSPIFYVLWVTFFLYEIPFIILLNYCKLFGQIWIHDDGFLTNMGTVMLVASFVFRVMSGRCIDKFGLRSYFICLMTALALINCWFYFTPMINRWLYFIATVIFGGILAGIFTSYVVASALIFGKTHVSTNFGMLMTSSLAVNIVAPKLIDLILDNFGWFVTFASSAVLSIINVISVLLSIPDV